MPQNRLKTGFRGPSPDVGRATQFKPGSSGNPGGRPKKKPITELYQKILANEENCKLIEASVIKTVLSGKTESILLLREMADRIEGKVCKTVQETTDFNLTLYERLQRARERVNQDEDRDHLSRPNDPRH